MALIFSFAVKSPDLHEVRKRAQTLGQADLSPFDIRPSNRHFDGLESAALRDEEIFDIETESIQLLERKNHLRRARLEKLKSALCVMEWQPGKHSHNEIEKL